MTARITPFPGRKPPSESGVVGRDAIIGWLENDEWFAFDLGDGTWTSGALADHLLIELGLAGLKIVPVA